MQINSRMKFLYYFMQAFIKISGYETASTQSKMFVIPSVMVTNKHVVTITITEVIIFVQGN